MFKSKLTPRFQRRQFCFSLDALVIVVEKQAKLDIAFLKTKLYNTALYVLLHKI